MRKVISILFLLSFICVFSACSASQDELEQLKTEYEKYIPYFELINSIENGNFTEAFEILEGYQASAYYEHLQSGEIEEIIIDHSNWSDYFSVEKITEWQENQLGETEGFITHVCVVLSDEVAGRVLEEKTNIDFIWQAKCSVKNCTVDLDNRIVHYEDLFKSQSTTFGEPEILHGTARFNGKSLLQEKTDDQFVAAEIGETIIIGEYLLNGEAKPVCYDYEEIAIVDVQGILTLSKTN